MADMILYDTIGSSGDTTSATGSLHAKVVDLKDTINTQSDVKTSTRQSPRGVQPFVSYVTSLTTYQTALNITGKGKFLGCAITSLGYIEITIDGQLVICGKCDAVNGVTYYPSSNFPFNTTESNVIFSASGDQGNAKLSFKSSLVVRLRTNGASASLVMQYEKE